MHAPAWNVFVCLFLLLYVPYQQLWSLRDGIGMYELGHANNDFRIIKPNVRLNKTHDYDQKMPKMPFHIFKEKRHWNTDKFTLTIKHKLTI